MVGSIAFVTPPFAGHLNPILELTKAAAKAGHDVTVITGASKQPVVEKAGFHCIALNCLGAGVLESISDTDKPVRSNPYRLLKQLRSSLDVAIVARKELYGLWRENKPDLIVADSVAISAGIAAHKLSIPWITTIATPLALESDRGTPSYLGGWIEGRTLWSKSRDSIGRKMIRVAKRGLSFAVRRQLAILETSVYRSDGSEASYSPTAILGFGLNELEFQRDWPSVFHMIGPVFDNPEQTQAPTLPKGNKRILVTLGTHLPWAKASLCEDIKWLAEKRKDVFFAGSLGAYSHKAESTKLADNAVLYNFIPYSGVINKFDAIIHHGGAGVTYAAIAAGRPSIVVPHDYDQFDYAARISAKGAGIRVNKIRCNSMLAAMDRALTPSAFPNLAILSKAISQYNPGKSFLQIINNL